MAPRRFLDMGGGVHIEVPDGMTPEAAEADYLAGQKATESPKEASEPLGGSWLHTPAYLAQEVGRGGALLAGIPGTLTKLVKKYLPAPPLAGMVPEWAKTGAFGTRVPEGTLPDIGEVSQGYNKLLGTSLSPQDQVENYGGAIARNALPVAAALATGAPVLPTLASGINGPVAAETARQMGASPMLQAAIGFGAGLGAGSSVGAATSFLGARAAAQELTRSEAALASAKLAVASAAPGDTAAIRAAQDAFASAKEANLTAMRNSGLQLQDYSRKWLSEEMPKKLDEIWAPVDAAIPKDAPVNLGGFKRALDSINSKAGDLEDLAKLLKPSEPARLQDTFNRILAAKNPVDPLLAPKGLGDFKWSDVRDLRTTLGDSLSNPMVVKNVGAKNLNHLYAALSDDLGTTAKGLGVGDVYDAANIASRKLYDFAQGPLARVISGKTPDLAADPAPEKVAKALRPGTTDHTELAGAGFPVAQLEDPTLKAARSALLQTKRSVQDTQQQRRLEIAQLEDKIASSKAPPPKSSLLGRVGQSIAGAGIGRSVGTIAGGEAGLQWPADQAFGEAFGALLPWALPAVGHAVSPTLWRSGLLGATSPLINEQAKAR